MHREHLLEGPAPSKDIEKKRRFGFNNRWIVDGYSNHLISPGTWEKSHHCRRSFTLFIGSEDIFSQYVTVGLCPLALRQAAVSSRIQNMHFDLGFIDDASASFSVIRDKTIDRFESKSMQSSINLIDNFHL